MCNGLQVISLVGEIPAKNVGVECVQIAPSTGLSKSIKWPETGS